jgi:hypothetical protein
MEVYGLPMAMALNSQLMVDDDKRKSARRCVVCLSALSFLSAEYQQSIVCKFERGFGVCLGPKLVLIMRNG